MSLIQIAEKMTNKGNNTDKRIKFLLYKIKSKTATPNEEKEYLELLREGGYIDATEYNNYKKELEKGNVGIGEALVGIGLAVLVGVLIAELFKKN